MDRIEIVRGDITHEAADAIVNAANESLLGGGGVDGAIHRAAGPELLEACRLLGGCATGEAKITAGYGLSARHVIHTVGPVYRPSRPEIPLLLASCYQSSLTLARQYGCEIVAFPAISCGLYGYPLAEAAAVSVKVVREALAGQELPKLVRWVMFDSAAYAAWVAASVKLSVS